ncbi:large-conductance mechanosensitive channel protein MscL [Pseudoflavonifractor phocaeensis]|uniref:large-conductance mechanosensitive channel protein MscL n=1 Tax=Pseudoflavonifractor phocaeensis TaxID=1870988 RepID=UPI001F4087D8|nr:large-conductance mechanosensitive channel protein MscL [Pseudoflavonifractor phocaeensis]MCF2596255.1 large-conductance mechanosensitive channel protein MscL [Pseudoflavonifractor phocaeensis]
MKKFMEEFKAFAMRGNVVDMAVGVVVGGAFGKITNSLVNDIIMPAVSMLTGGINFSDWKFVLKEAVVENGEEIAAAVSINYGTLLSTILDFIILAFAVFCMVKFLNNLHRKKEEAPAEEPAPPEPSAEEKLLTEIRDLLKEQR